jgi:hypothetical protein
MLATTLFGSQRQRSAEDDLLGFGRRDVMPCDVGAIRGAPIEGRNFGSGQLFIVYTRCLYT